MTDSQNCQSIPLCLQLTETRSITTSHGWVDEYESIPNYPLQVILKVFQTVYKHLVILLSG